MHPQASGQGMHVQEMNHRASPTWINAIWSTRPRFLVISGRICVQFLSLFYLNGSVDSGLLQLHLFVGPLAVGSGSVPGA